MNQGAPVQMQPDGTSENTLLQDAPLANKVRDRVTVRNRSDTLGDDGAFVQIPGDVVARRTDQLDPPPMGGMIGPRAGEGGEEGVVNVDDAVRESIGDAGAQDLHVTRQDDEINAVLPQERDLRLLLRWFCFLGDREVMKRDLKAIRDGAQV